MVIPEHGLGLSEAKKKNLRFIQHRSKSEQVLWVRENMHEIRKDAMNLKISLQQDCRANKIGSINEEESPNLEVVILISPFYFFLRVKRILHLK